MAGLQLHNKRQSFINVRIHSCMQKLFAPSAYFRLNIMEQSKPESYPHGAPFFLFLPSPHMSTSARADQNYEVKKSKYATYSNQGEGPDMLCYSG